MEGEGVSFDDLPLLSWEKIVFAEVTAGSWCSIYDLEDNLTLDELLELHDAALEKRHENMRLMASMWGSSDIPSWEDAKNPYESKDIVKTNADLVAMPINVGLDSPETAEVPEWWTPEAQEKADEAARKRMRGI